MSDNDTTPNEDEAREPESAPAPATALVDARPFLRRTEDTIWSHTNEIRDVLHDVIVVEAADAGFEVLVQKSPDFEYPATVRMEAWLPADQPNYARRVALRIVITPKPHHREAHEFAIAWKRDGRSYEYGDLVKVDDRLIRHLVRHLLQNTRKPSFTAYMQRTSMIQVMRAPANKIRDLGINWRSLLLWLVVAVGAIVVAANWDEHRSPERQLFEPPILIGGLIVIVGLVAQILRALLAKPIIYVDDKPMEEPRRLRVLDSWQAMIPDLGSMAEVAIERFSAELAGASDGEARLRKESIAYVGPDGMVERDQLVVSLRRGLAFCHIYAYGDDLFVGWDAHVNYGEWQETDIASGHHKHLKRKVEIRSLQPGFHPISEYDLMDVNFLSELVHGTMRRVVERLLAERKIDREIDFTVQRGERRSLLDEREQGGKPERGRAAPACAAPPDRPPMYLARFDDGDGALVLALVHLAPPTLWDDERAEARFNEALARHLRAALSLDLAGLGYRLTLDADGAVHRRLLLLADAGAEDAVRRFLGAIALLESIQADSIAVPMSREAFDREADTFPPHQLAIETGLLAGPDGLDILDDFRLLPQVPQLLADAAGTGQGIGYQLNLSPYRPDGATLRATARQALELEAREAPDWLAGRGRSADARLREACWAVEERAGAETEESARWLARALTLQHDRALPGIQSPDFSGRPDGEREALSMPAHALFFDGAESYEALERAGFAERTDTIADLLDWRPPYRLSRPEAAGPVSPRPEPPPDPGAAIRDAGAYEGSEPFLFISYRHADRQRVMPVLEALSEGGLLYWIDTGLHAGDEWDTVLEERICACAAVMAMTSQSYVGSKYCRREVKYADVLNKPILPVLLEPVSLAEGLHMLFQQYQIFDASEAVDYGPLIADILRLVRASA